MSALGVGISDRDPVTWHEHRPGRFNLIGQQKTEALIAANRAADEAWKKYNQAVDDWLDGLIDREEIDHLYLELLSADAVVQIEQTNWNHSFFS